MTRDSMGQIGEALVRLPTLGRAELRAEWLRLYGTEAPARLGRELLIAAIAYRRQAEVLGGLRPELRRRLRSIAEAAGRSGEAVLATPLRLKPGTRLIREWQGRAHEVVVCVDGFLWQRTQYRSLSQIARAITGTRWSGPVFFGLKPRTATPCRIDGEIDAPA
jgi:hypothetical protein